MHENRETSRASARADRSGKVKDPSSVHVRFGGVRLRHSTDEADHTSFQYAQPGGRSDICHGASGRAKIEDQVDEMPAFRPCGSVSIVGACVGDVAFGENSPA